MKVGEKWKNKNTKAVCIIKAIIKYEKYIDKYDDMFDLMELTMGDDLAPRAKRFDDFIKYKFLKDNGEENEYFTHIMPRKWFADSFIKIKD